MNPLALLIDRDAVLVTTLEIGIRATALLGLALGAQWLVGRRRTLVRLAIGHACLVGLLLLPAAIVALPALDFACLPTMAVHDPGQESGRVEWTNPARSEPSGMVQGPSAAPAGIAGGSAEPAGQGASGAPSELGGLGPSIDPVWWGIAAYFVVSLILVLRLVVSLAGIVHLKRRSVPVEDPEWLEALGRWCGQLGIKRGVELVWSSDVGVPVVVGVLRPTILLPISLTRPEGSRHRDAVILHELAHVRRSDFAWNLILRSVQALYWLHPLAWPLGAIIVALRERACDAHCVALLGGPGPYREALLDVAAGAIRRPAPALGLAISRGSSLERRLHMIRCSTGEARCLSTARTRAAIGVAVLAAVALIGMIRPVAGRAVAEGTRPGVLRLEVVAAETGKPIADAEVRVLVGLKDLRLKVDDRGCLDIPHSAELGDASVTVIVHAGGYAMQAHAWGVGRKQSSIPVRAEVRMHAGTKLGGIVQDERGRPIAGASVVFVDGELKQRDRHESLFTLLAKTGADGRWATSAAPELAGGPVTLRVTHPDFLSARQFRGPLQKLSAEALRSSEAVSVMKRGMPIVGRVVDADGRPLAGALVAALPREFMHLLLLEEFKEFGSRTDADGRFRTGPVEAGGFALVAMAEGHSAGLASVDAIPGVLIPAEIRLGRSKTISGRVVDPGGEPVAGACVAFAEWKEVQAPWATLITDADGRFRWDDAPDGEIGVGISKAGYLGAYPLRLSAAEGERVHVLRPGVLVSGQVRDSVAQSTVKVKQVEYGMVDPKTGSVTSWATDPKSNYAEGSFSLRIETKSAFRFRLTAAGYEPFVSRILKPEDGGNQSCDANLVALGPDRPLVAVLKPDGTPLAGANIFWGEFRRRVHIQRDPTDNPTNDQLKSDSQGRFRLPRTASDWLCIAVLGDESCAVVKVKASDSDQVIRTGPYGRVAGQYRIGSRPAVRQPIVLEANFRHESTAYAPVSCEREGVTDEEGRFAFEKVVPLAGYRVGRFDRWEGLDWVFRSGDLFEIRPGETASVIFGGSGRPVVGKIEPPSAWAGVINCGDRCSAVLSSANLKPSEKGYVYCARGLEPDGSVRIEDIPAGEYRVRIRVNGTDSRRDLGPFGILERTFTIPPMAGGRSDEPFDLGVMRLERRIEAAAR